MSTQLDEQTRAFVLDDQRLLAFLDRLSGGKAKTVALSDVWRVFADVYPNLPSGPERRMWLATALDELESRSDLRLPVRRGKLWDRTSTVALPTRITLIAHQATQPDTNDWKTFAWHPRLQWVLERRHVRLEHVEFLKRVNRGLIEGWFDVVENLKYRSLQLTGDEKRLQQLIRSKLFGPRKLTLDLLGCEEEVLPIAIDRVSEASTMLMFENAAPFMLARKLLRELVADGSRVCVGCVAYGAGKQVAKSAGYLTTVEPKVNRVLYVGDLDAEGIQIAADLKRASVAVEVQPATAWHSAMFESAAELSSPEGWPVKDDQPHVISATAMAFIDPSVRSACERLIHNGRRIPEEAISHNWMRRLLANRPGQERLSEIK